MRKSVTAYMFNILLNFMNQPKSNTCKLHCNIFICKCTPQVARITSERLMERLKMTDIACCQGKRLQWASEGGTKPPWILQISAKKVVFFVLSGKTKFHYFWQPLEKFWKNPLVVPHWKKFFRRPCAKPNQGKIWSGSIS